MSVNAVVFNLNGSLLNYDNIRFDALKEVLSRYKITVTKARWENEYRYFTTKETIRDIVISNQIKDKEEKIIKRFERVCRSLVKEFGVEEVPGADQFVRYLISKKIKVMVCSDLSKVETKIVLSKSSFKKLKFISLNDYEKTKPYFDCYKKCVEKLDVMPHSIAVFENTLQGVVSAKGAGCNVFAVNFYDPTNLNKAKVTKNIKNYTELNFVEFIYLL